MFKWIFIGALILGCQEDDEDNDKGMDTDTKMSDTMMSDDSLSTETDVEDLLDSETDSKSADSESDQDTDENNSECSDISGYWAVQAICETADENSGEAGVSPIEIVQDGCDVSYINRDDNTEKQWIAEGVLDASGNVELKGDYDMVVIVSTCSGTINSESILLNCSSDNGSCTLDGEKYIF